VSTSRRGAVSASATIRKVTTCDGRCSPRGLTRNGSRTTLSAPHDAAAVGVAGTAAGAMASVRAALRGMTDTVTRSIIGGVQPGTSAWARQALTPNVHAPSRVPSTSHAGSPS
jgi:hypothetical protein